MYDHEDKYKLDLRTNTSLDPRPWHNTCIAYLIGVGEVMGSMIGPNRVIAAAMLDARH